VLVNADSTYLLHHFGSNNGMPDATFCN